MIPLSIVFMLAVGMKLEEYKPTKDVDINSKVKREVSKEPWYAIGGMVIFFSVVVAISTISGGEVPLI